MTQAVPGGVFTPIAGYPSFPLDALTKEEAAQANYLVMRIMEQRPVFDLAWSYYDGLQRMQDLGISIPPQLSRLRTVVGWPQIGVDALTHRLVVEGFRYPGATDVDDELMAIWQANNLDGEAPLAHLEAIVSGRCYLIAGAPDTESTTGLPLITAESPRNMSVIWDARLRRVTAALQVYYDTDYSSDQYGYQTAVYYTPDKTVFMSRRPTATADSGWETSDVDEHGLGFVPIVRMGNRQRLSERSGHSEITAAWMNTVDSACRTLLGMEVSRELHSAPRRLLLGATEEMFQRPDGTTVSKWQAYMDQLWMIERDENGELPTIQELKPSDPSPYTKLIDTYTEIMAMNMGLPAAMLGKSTQGNPASADAIRVSYEELTARARAKQTAFSEAWEQIMRYALMIKGGSMPENITRIETDWRDPAPRTLAGDSDAITKQITVGAVPATSDVTLKRLGYSAVERERLAQDRAQDQGESLLLQIAHSLDTRAISEDQRVEKAAVTSGAVPAASGGTGAGSTGAPSSPSGASGKGGVAPAGPARPQGN